MTRTVPMSVQDALWLTMDRPNNLMVVDGAMMLAGQPSMDRVRAEYEKVVRRFPVFARKAVPVGAGWAWEDDPDFDLDRHLELVELPEGSDVTDVQHFLAEQRTVALPKDRPLWRTFLLSPVMLDDGTVGSALCNRFHHAIADGVRLTQLMLSMCDAEGTAAAPVVVARGGGGGPLDLAKTVLASVNSAATGATRVVKQVSITAGSGVIEAVRNPVDAALAVPRRVLRTPRAVAHGVTDGFEVLRRPDHLLDALEVLGMEANRGTNDLSSVTKLAFTSSDATVWTGTPGTKKAIAWSKPMPLADIKAVGRATGTTVNDVVISAVAAGLRRWLEERDAVVDEVNWMVPVNLKPFEDNLPEELGNYFALVFLPMPLTDMTRRERLAAMHQRMSRIKHSDEAVLTFGLQKIVSQSPSQVQFFLTNFFANKTVGVLTNVPGPQTRLTFAGVPMWQVVGFAPCSGDQPMTATIFSYNGEVTVGFAADADLMPDPALLSQFVVDELAGLHEEFVG